MKCMKKKIWIGASVAILLLLMLMVGMALYQKEMKVAAASVVFDGEPYHVHFSSPIDKQSIQQGKVYVVDEKGNKVDADISLSDSRRTLTIKGLNEGKYILHIDRKPVEFQVIKKLESVKSVEELKRYFQAVLAMYEQDIGRERGIVVEEKASDSSSSGHSTINNQVEGIDEGDIVITDGDYIYTIVEQTVKIVDAQNPKNLRYISTIQLEQNSYPQLLLKEGDYLILLLDEFVQNKGNAKGFYMGHSFTKAAIYDVKDASKPKLVKEFGQEGYMNGVRQYNGVLYMISNYSPNFWKLEEQDVELRPHIIDGKKVALLEIENISIIPGTLEPSYTIISAIDLNQLTSKKVNTKGYLGSTSTLYMSPNALYLTAFDVKEAVPIERNTITLDTDVSIVQRRFNDQKTKIYKMLINGTSIEFAATASVKGHVLNQFSMDEHNGYFRIATTEGFASGKQANSKNHLFIFDETLKQVGEVSNLAKGERIYSVRYMGDKAYIVTFRETDPLFVIDTSKPSNPKVLGELKIPGFSNYLHPLGENHLIGIGYAAEQRMDSWSKEPITVTTGIKISLFDVSNLSKPKELDSVVVGGRGTYSEAEHNHKAFFRNEALNYYGFPVVLYEEDKKDELHYKGIGALVYEITTERGIQLKGDLVTPAKADELYEDWNSAILRLVYVDNALFTVSPKEVKSYDIKTFQPLGQVKISK